MLARRYQANTCQRSLQLRITVVIVRRQTLFDPFEVVLCECLREFDRIRDRQSHVTIEPKRKVWSNLFTRLGQDGDVLLQTFIALGWSITTRKRRSVKSPFARDVGPRSRRTDLQLRFSPSP